MAGNVKKLLHRTHRGTPHIEVYYEGGGEVPRDLQGLYTSANQAEKAIELYLIKKNRTNATTSSK